MPVVINYEQPIFWNLVNADGIAASVHGEVSGRSIIVNLYWSGVLLATRQEGSDSKVLREEVQGFLAEYRPKQTDEQIQHFEFAGDRFRRIVDPKWVTAV